VFHLVALACLSFLIVLHEFGHYFVARWTGMHVLRFSLGFGPSLWRKTFAGTTWQVAALPLGGFVHIQGLGPLLPGDAAWDDPRSFRNRPWWARVLVIFAGPLANWLLAVAFAFALAASVGFGHVDPSSTVLDQVVDGPAQAAGLLPGDRVLAIDGAGVRSWQHMVALVEPRAGDTLRVQVERGDARLTLQVTPRAQAGVGKIGVAGPRADIVRLSAADAIPYAIGETTRLTFAQCSFLVRMIAGREEGQLSGLPGIVRVIAGQAKQGLRRLLMLLTNLSIGLSILNLLPIPALDGGRLGILVLELLRRRPLSARAEGLFHGVGFAFLFGLMVYVSIRDLL
jgi:regulator of sigma E protease